MKNIAIVQPKSFPELSSQAQLDLFYNVSQKINSAPQMERLLEHIIIMTQEALHASAASILLIHGNERELFFETASGPVEKVLKHVKVDSLRSIAGIVLRTGKPLIVNDVNKNHNFLKIIDEFTGFTTKSLICVPLITNQETIGVLEVLNKLNGTDFDESDMHMVVPVATTAAMAIENTRLHQNLLEAYMNTIETLAETIDAKDMYTSGHSRRVKALSLMTGQFLKLSTKEMETLKYASILHDIGKITIDSDILTKTESLTSSEWEIMRDHPISGANLLKKIPFLEKASPLVLHHHERYDGTGYPGRLKGESIPLGSRIIAIADAFDSMTTSRSYRAALDIEYAIKEVENAAGTQFCPITVGAFVSSVRDRIKNRAFIPPSNKAR